LQILLDPDLHHHYHALLRDPEYPVPFPPFTVGSLLASGVQHPGSFIVDRIHRYVPTLEQRTVRVPLRALRFQGPFAVYRNSRRQLLIRLDRGVLPLAWTQDWNQWVHGTSGSIQVTAHFWQQTRFRRRGDQCERMIWQRPAVSTLAVRYPDDIADQFEQACVFWKRFGPYAEQVALLRARMEREPVEMKEARRWCEEQGPPAHIDVRFVNWHPDYQEFYFQELARRAQ